jgi:formylglycine-generating enzyme required for sulfatase activity
VTKIIISYRRSDSDLFAGRVRDRIAADFGEESVFIDVDNIPFGKDFRVHIQEALTSADAVLVVVGPRWLGRSKGGRSRIMDDTDPVRIEVETALSKGVPTIPILVGQTNMPKPDQLPESLRNFAFINAAPVDTGRDFHRDLNRIIAAINAILERPTDAGNEHRIREAGAENQRAEEQQPRNGAEVKRRAEADERADQAQHARQMEVELQKAEEDRRLKAFTDAQRLAEVERFKEQAREGVAKAQGTGVHHLGDEADKNLRIEEEKDRRPRPELPRERRRSLLAPVVFSLIIVAIIGAIFLYVTAVPTSQSSDVSALSPEREGALKPKDTFKECANCPKMVVAPAGSFTMGSPESEPGRSAAEGPQHRVTLARPFAVGQFELTFDEWDACLADGGCNQYKPSNLAGGRGHQPVIYVPWGDAVNYVTWLSKKTGRPYRLLSEAEYEYASRAGGQTAFPWGDEIGKGNANCIGCGSQWDGKFPAPVGSFPPNGFGLYDMVGNVWAWTQDCAYDGYAGAPTDGSARTFANCATRVVRGGSWDSGPQTLRSAYRNWDAPVPRLLSVGLRVGRTLNR